MVRGVGMGPRGRSVGGSWTRRLSGRRPDRSGRTPAGYSLRPPVHRGVPGTPPEPGAPRPSSAPSTGACAPACREKKAQGAIMRDQLVVTHALLSDPGAGYRDLGTGYYEQRDRTRRRASSHVRSLERLGYKVTIEPLTPEADPETGELITRTAS